MIDPEAIQYAKLYEPILLFHPDERFFPIDPKFYLERCALWRSDPASDDKQWWGEPPLTSAPRRPQIAKGNIAALETEVTAGKEWIGKFEIPVSERKSPYLVIPKRPEERPHKDDRFLQLIGWEPFAAASAEVTKTSENRHPTLDKTFYDAALTGSRPWYYAEYLGDEALLDLVLNEQPHGLDLVDLVKQLDHPRLLTYHFFYALHEEPLRGCETAGEGQTFATFAGEWTSFSILFDANNKPHFVAVTSRNVGDPTSLPGEENRFGTTVHPWKEVDRVGDHPKIFVSRGTHGNYLTVGPHDLTPFTPGDIDLNQGTCAQIEKLDDVIPGGEEQTIGEARDPDEFIYALKLSVNLFGGLVWALLEDATTYHFAQLIPALEPNRKPQDDTGGPLFGLILKPAGLFVPEQASAQRLEEWPTKMPDPADPVRYDFIVDRETQLWWAPRQLGRAGDTPRSFPTRRGFAGRWGPRVTNDPKTRRSGMRCPDFAIVFLEGVARL